MPSWGSVEVRVTHLHIATLPRGTAVLINEFGEIGLDHHLLERIDEAMVMLQSGCVCCTIRGELSTAIKDLHSRRERGLLPPFRRLVVESTGLADPFPILSTVRSDPVLRHHFCLGNVITTVDAVNGAQQLDAHPKASNKSRWPTGWF
jgi:G3E family GTPase